MDLQESISTLAQGLIQGSEDPRVLVRRLVYILPLVKNPLNLNLLMEKLANAPYLFATLESTTFLVDGICAAATRKRTISNPTISFESWLQHLTQTVERLPALPGLAIASGLLLAKPNKTEMLSKIILRNSTLLTDDCIEPGIACLAKAQWNLDEFAKSGLPHDRLLGPAISIVFSPSFLYRGPENELMGHVFVEFGAYSHLLAILLYGVRDQKLVEVYFDSARKHVDFLISGILVIQEPIFNDYKTLLFGLALQLQGLCNRVLHSRMLDAVSICRNILLLLFPLGFVIDEIGGKFDAYEYVFNLCLDILIESKSQVPNLLVSQLTIGWQNIDQVNIVGKGKLLFILDLAEKLLPALSSQMVDQTVLPIAKHYFIPTNLAPTSVFEAAHQFALSYLEAGSSPLAKSIPAQETDLHMLRYLNTVLKLYPSVLSFDQFCTAIDSIVVSLAHPTDRETDITDVVLDTIFTTAKKTMPGHKIEDGPPTLRAAYIAALLRMLPTLCDAYVFAVWLSRIESMIPQPYSDATSQERLYIKKALIDMVSKLDLVLADVGIRFWFERGSRL